MNVPHTIEVVRQTLAVEFCLDVDAANAETFIKALSAAGVKLVNVSAYTTVVNVHQADPLLVALTGSAGRAPGAYDDQAYRE